MSGSSPAETEPAMETLWLGEGLRNAVASAAVEGPSQEWHWQHCVLLQGGISSANHLRLELAIPTCI